MAGEKTVENRSYPKSVQPGIPRLTALPEGWSRLRLGEVLTPVRRPVQVEDQKEYRLLKARRSRGGIVERERKFGRDILTSTQFWARSDDFLISRRQIAHGACGIVPSDLDLSLVSNEYATLRPTELLDAGFLRHWPHSIYFQQTCFHSSIGVHVEKLVFNLERWLAWEFNTPPLPNQRRIARILDAFDSYQEDTKLLRNERQRQKIAFAENLLIRNRENTRILSEFALINPQSHSVAQDILVSFVPMEHVSEDGLLLPHPKKTRSEIGIGFTSFIEKDVLVAKITPCFENGKGALAKNLKNGIGFGSTEFHVIRAKSDIRPKFIYHHTMTEAFRKNGARVMTGSAGQRRVPAEYIKDYRLRVPCLEEQDRIVAFLDAIDDEISFLARRIELLRKQKRGLMQKLLTGQISVPASIDRLMPGGDLDETAA